MKRKIKSALVLMGALSLTAACGKWFHKDTPLTICSSTSEVKGRVNFATPTVNKNAKIVIQYSFNNFIGVHLGGVYTNPLGWLSLPFNITESVKAFCPLSGGRSIQVRAFQDNNGDLAWNEGEPSGRDDGTMESNATFLIHSVGPLDYNIVFTSEIFLDSTEGQ